MKVLNREEFGDLCRQYARANTEGGKALCAVNALNEIQEIARGILEPHACFLSIHAKATTGKALLAAQIKTYEGTKRRLLNLAPGVDSKDYAWYLACKEQAAKESTARKEAFNSQHPMPMGAQLKQGHYAASITWGGKRIDLGTFNTLEEAKEAFNKKLKECMESLNN